MYKFRLILLVFIPLIIFLRLYKLGDIPQGLTKDEAYYGYDAYSILRTGHDIWGQRLPLRFKSTGEYKLGLTYFIVPSIKLFDLNTFSVRLPSAVFGLLTLAILFFTLRIFNVSRYLSLLSVASFAFTPWAFGMSRLFYESNVGLFFIAIGFYGLVHYLSNPNSKWLTISPIFLALASYLYSSYFYIGASILLLFFIISRKILVKPLVIYLLIIIPMLLISHGGTKRLAQEWALKMPGYAMHTDDARMSCYLSFGKNAVLAKLCYPFWNKPVNQVTDITKTFFRTISPEFLFFKGVNEYITPDDTGAYPLSYFPLYFLGAIALTRILARKKELRPKIFLLVASTLLSVAIISLPGRVELYRDPVGLYFIFIIFALGLAWTTKIATRWHRHLGFIVMFLYAIIILFDQTKYLIEYFTHYTKSIPLTFSSDAQEVYNYLADHKDYQYLVDRKFHGPIYAAFYWKIDPVYFQSNVVWTEPDPWGWVNAKSIGNIYSTEMTIEQLLCMKKSSPMVPIKALVVSDPNPIYSDYAVYSTYGSFGTLRLHDIYDIDLLYDLLPAHLICSDN